MANLVSTQIKSDPEEFDFDAQLDGAFDFLPSDLTSEDIAEDDFSFRAESPSTEQQQQQQVLPAEEKVPPKPKRHATFSAHSVQVIAEQNLKMGLTKAGRASVQKNMAYRIRQLIHCSAQLMHHSNRTKLTTNDVSKAMQELDCDTIFGHNNSQQGWSSFHYRYVPEAFVYISGEPTIDLRLTASTIISRRCETEATAPKSPTTTTTTTTTTLAFTLDWPQMKHSICDNSSLCTSDDSTQRSAKLEKYFTQLSVTLANINCTKYANLSASEKNSLLRLIFFDLSTNCNIKPVLHRFIKFALHALRTLQLVSPANIDPLAFSETKLESYHVYLRTVRALMSNPHFTGWALHSDSVCNLAEVLLSLTFDLRLCGDLSLLYHRSLYIRSQFAQLFGQILFRFCLPFTDLQHQLISLLYAKIRDYQSNLSSLSWTDRAAIDYSILLLHRYMGFDVCLRFLLPLLTHQDAPFEEYFTEKVHRTTQSKVQANLQNVACTLVRGEICLVGELIMKGLALLIVQVLDDSVCVDFANQVYAYFSERFGGTLAARLCPLPELATARHNGSEWSKAWKTHLGHYTSKRPVNGETCATVQPTTTPVATRTRTDSTTSTSKQDLPETSPNKNRKRKGTGLLESMLSTDTSMMAKNESLSMFTESLLEASHRQYEKELPTRIFMFHEEYREFALSSDASTAINPLIVFEGKRIRESAMPEELFEPDSHNVIKATLRYPTDPSLWHTLWLRTFNPNKRAYLPGFPSPWLFEWKRESEKTINLEEHLAMFDGATEVAPDSIDAQRVSTEDAELSKKTAPGNSSSSRTQSHIFHYHRRKQHLRSNFSLFTQL